MSRTPPLSPMTVSLALALGLGAISARASAAEACTIAIKGDGPVVKACKDGGIVRARKVMKEMLAAAKEKGFKKTTDCTDCHKTTEDYTLNKGATDQFAKMLALTK